jgi:hypothetical protein
MFDVHKDELIQQQAVMVCIEKIDISCACYFFTF